MGMTLLIREPQADTARQFSARVYFLGALYAILFLSSIAGLVLIIQWARLFVTLAQRSNVETLILLFFVAFYLYFVFLSWRGAAGTLRLLFYSAIGAVKGREAAERMKTAHLRQPAMRHSVAVNLVVESDEGPRAFQLKVADDFGEIGVLEIDGARLTYHANYKGSSSEVFIYLVHQANQLLQPDYRRRLDIVEWDTINGESLEQYVAMVEFGRNLARSLNIDEAWPRLKITERDCRELEARLSEVCPALRNESFLPQWEYSADHKLPLIPEPLGLFSLGISEKRVDPLASMGAATFIVGTTVVAFLLVVLVPPWVPGA